MLTIFTPFERTESSSLETNENRSLATKVGSLGLSMDGNEIEVDGVVAPVESNGRVATLVCVAEESWDLNHLKTPYFVTVELARHKW